MHQNTWSFTKPEECSWELQHAEVLPTRVQYKGAASRCQLSSSQRCGLWSSWPWHVELTGTLSSLLDVGLPSLHSRYHNCNLNFFDIKRGSSVTMQSLWGSHVIWICCECDDASIAILVFQFLWRRKQSVAIEGFFSWMLFPLYQIR